MSRPALLSGFLAFGWALSAGVALHAGARSEEAQVAWLRKEAVTLRSIEPGDEDFSDLEPLRALLAKKRIVVLGEASHGDGTAFLAKSRLVRFLHKELGFDVLAFESGFYDCRKAWQRIEAGDDPATAFSQSVFSIWTRSAQVQPLIAYFATAARSKKPLELAGFDPQFTGEMSQRLLDDLKRVAVAAGLPGDEWATRISEPLANLTDGRYEYGELPPPAARAELGKALDELIVRLRKAGGDLPERGFWLQFAESTRQFATSSWSTDWKKPLMEDPEGFAVRDRLMGENLAWLAQHPFAGRKIIVWAASFHAAREVDEIDVPSSPVHMRLFRTFQPMGAVARKELADQMYTLAILAYQGRHGTLSRPIEIEPPIAGSLEDLFHRTGLALAFLDLSRTGHLPGWLKKPLVARAMGYKDMRARWGRVFDAVLFVDKMAISEKKQ
jgi:erythromycin esterase